MLANGPSMTRCPTRTVDDAPASEDDFGSHAPIAAAVRELVTTEPGGRTIGLEGGWGSGKSTVVRLLNDRLDGSGTQVVVFDAWAHEGDPLRRSFLETLIKSVSAKGWIKEEAWDERRESLARRRRVEHTRPVSRIERPAIIAGAIAAFFAILVPLGAALIEAGLAANRSRAFWVGVAVYAVLVALIGSVTARLLRGRFGTEGGAFLSLFSVESVTESTRETIETPDPTSVEFESTFRDLVREALGADPARRLVLVVDNLDRVSPNAARSIWATLQTFLHHSHDNREPWLDSLWVLLPYDRDGIARLWDESVAVVSDAPHPGATLADSFIDKSIQVRFEVPLPLLSDWRSYVETTLRLALPNCGEADGYTAYRLYAHRLADSDRPPSPREIKQYINRIGALHRRWQHELPFASLAYYASLGIDGVQVADRLRRGMLPESGPADLLDDDIDAHLAAIAFNTNPERARQLLLGPLLDRALSRDTSDELVELLDRPGFWEALPLSPIVQSGMGKTALLKAAASLHDVPEPQRPRDEWSEVTLQFARQGLADDNWPPLTHDSADRFSQFLSLVPQETAADIAERMTAPIPEGGASAWAEGTHALLGQIEWLTVHASGAPEAVCSALAHFATLTSSAQRAGRLKVDPGVRAALAEAIVEQVAQSPGEALNALSVLHRSEPDIDWGPLVEAAGNQLRNGIPSVGAEHQPTPSQSRSLLEIMVIAPGHSPKERAALVEEGIALEYAWLASERGNDSALGDWLYEEIRQFTAESWATRSYPGYASSGKALVDALLADPPAQPLAPLAQAIERRGDFDVIASIGVNGEGEALAAALVAESWQSDRFVAALDGYFFRALWPHIALAGASDELDIDDLVRVACARPTLVTELESVSFAEDLMSMYAAVISAHPDRGEAAHLANWVAGKLSSLDSKQWQTAIAESHDWVALLDAIRSAAPSARIGGAFGQALAKFVEKIANKEEGTTLKAENWQRAVVPLLAPAVYRTYAEGVAKAAIKDGSRATGTFFALVGDTLKEPRLFFRPEILNGLLPDLVTEQNSAGLTWLIHALQNEEVRRNAPADAFNALAEVVRTAYSHDEDDDQQLQNIAALIGLDLQPLLDE